MGDRGALLSRAFGALEALGSVRAFSHVFETDPLGPSTLPYLNAALALRTDLAPHELLQRLLAIETANGRVRTQRWGARTLDLDLLLAGDNLIEEAALTVPHPRLCERAFVLAPLVCIAAETTIPGRNVTVRSAWNAIPHVGIGLYAGHDVPEPHASDLSALQGS